MTQKTSSTTLLGLLSQTSIHAGTGQNTGVIDLPIQREGHNGWPCVFGSAVKGALRTRAEEEYDADNDSVIYVFGSDTNNASDHAGAMTISDARLLLLPVRSLTSQFKWVTCPAAINRFIQDASRFGIQVSITDDFNVTDEDTAWVTADQKEARIFLEEYRFNTKPVNLNSLINALLLLMKGVNKETLEQQLVIVNNDNFSHLSQHVTPVNAHIAIDSETKIVKPGALWYEETLPPETLLYTGLSAVASRKKRSKKEYDSGAEASMNAQQIMGAVTALFDDHSWLQLGGNETVGMGWCAVSILDSDSANSNSSGGDV